jgi:hypothetical protein
MTDGITVFKGGTMFAGRDAVEFFRVAVLKSALGLLKEGITPRKGLSMTKALRMCKDYTGKDYKRKEVDKAIADLTSWMDVMQTTIPRHAKH